MRDSLYTQSYIIAGLEPQTMSITYRPGDFIARRRVCWEIQGRLPSSRPSNLIPTSAVFSG
jgi:hypothetical protein